MIQLAARLNTKARTLSSSAILCLALLILAVVFAGSAVSQQPSPDAADAKPDQHQSADQVQANPKKDERYHFGRELAKESREAAGEDDTAEFKQSASVQFLARITGMSLQHAYWLAVLLNFAVIAVTLIWISKKYLPGAFRNRTAAIQKAMEEARKASMEANQRLSEIESRLARLGAEINEMRATAESDAKAEEARILAAAEEDKHKIIASAEQEIAAAAKQARRELAAHAADLAVALASKQIHVDATSDQTLVRSFAQNLASNDSKKGAS